MAGSRWEPEVEGRWKEREGEREKKKDRLGNEGLYGAKRADLLGLPAASEIVNCHSGCRQTSKTDIICPYYPPLLKLSPVHPPFCSPSSSILHSISTFFLFFFARAHACIWTPLIYFLYLPPPLLSFLFSPGLSLSLVFFFPLMKWVSLQYTLPSHCSMVRCLSIGGRECLGSFPCFTSLPV